MILSRCEPKFISTSRDSSLYSASLRSAFKSFHCTYKLTGPRFNSRHERANKLRHLRWMIQYRKASTVSKNKTGNANPNSGNHELVAGDMLGTKPANINSNPKTTVAGKAMILSNFMLIGFAGFEKYFFLFGAEVVIPHLRNFIEDGVHLRFGWTAMAAWFRSYTFVAFLESHWAIFCRFF